MYKTLVSLVIAAVALSAVPAYSNTVSPSSNDKVTYFNIAPLDIEVAYHPTSGISVAQTSDMEELSVVNPEKLVIPAMFGGRFVIVPGSATEAFYGVTSFVPITSTTSKSVPEIAAVPDKSPSFSLLGGGLVALSMVTRKFIY